MSDDSVPLPFPNLRLAEYAFQLQRDELSHLHAEASRALWAGIEEDEMAPYMHSLPASFSLPSSALLSELEKKNTAELERIDAKIKNAETDMGETDMAESLRERAGYLCRIGDKDKAIPALDVALEKTAGLGARIDLVLAKMRMGMFYRDDTLVTGNMDQANKLIDQGGDWDRRNRLKVYRALHHLSIRQFGEAATLLIDSLSTYTATELMEYEDFVALCIVAAGVGCDRATIKSKILSSAEVNGLMPQLPVLTTFTKSLYEGDYAAFFTSLAAVEETYLLPSRVLSPHAGYYVREMRIKAYSQLLESYRSLTLDRMSRAFGVSTAFMDADLCKFIALGRLACTIDKVSGVITTNRVSSENKTSAYEAVVKQGDILLNEIQKLSRVIG